MADQKAFGTTPDGKTVHRVCLEGGGLRANFLTWGASLQSLHLEGHAPSLVLGFDSLEDYIDHGLYFGASVGRFSNRVANGRFQLDGKSHQLDQNQNGQHTLHGGSEGCSTQIWTIADLGSSHVDFILRLEDGHMGFTGNATLTCSYVLKDDGTLAVTYVTRSDAPTLAGMTHHSYFTLDGEGDVRDHEFQFHADEYLPVDAELIPTGTIQTVDKTPFDFRKPSDLRERTDAGTVYDHNFCLSHTRRNLQHVATVQSARSHIKMDVATTEPGLQFYAAHAMDIHANGLEGKQYGAFSGFALEPQNWPDAPNHDSFPNAILRPDEELRQSSTFRFSYL